MAILTLSLRVKFLHLSLADNAFVRVPSFAGERDSASHRECQA